MEWMKVNSEEELRALGKFKEVKENIKRDLERITDDHNINNKIKIASSSWRDQFKKIKELQMIAENFNRVEYDTSPYFKDEVTEYIFYLLELDGQARMDKLKIYKSYYYNKEEAKKWRDNIVKKIHPDRIKTEEAAKAMEELNSIYNNMVNNE